MYWVGTLEGHAENYADAMNSGMGSKDAPLQEESKSDTFVEGNFPERLHLALKHVKFGYFLHHLGNGRKWTVSLRDRPILT